MISEKERSRIGKEAANRGIANEHIALGILMHRYNASKVDLPSSKYDILIEKKNKMKQMKLMNYIYLQYEKLQ